jgi:hypothetical protein
MCQDSFLKECRGCKMPWLPSRLTTILLTDQSLISLRLNWVNGDLWLFEQTGAEPKIKVPPPLHNHHRVSQGVK